MSLCEDIVHLDIWSDREFIRNDICRHPILPMHTIELPGVGEYVNPAGVGDVVGDVGAAVGGDVVGDSVVGVTVGDSVAPSLVGPLVVGDVVVGDTVGDLVIAVRNTPSHPTCHPLSSWYVQYFWWIGDHGNI